MAHLHSNQFTNVDTIWNGCVFYFTVLRWLFSYNYEIVSLCYTSISQFHIFMHPMPVCRVVSPSLPLLFIFNFCFLPCHTWSRIVQQQFQKLFSQALLDIRFKIESFPLFHFYSAHSVVCWFLLLIHCVISFQLFVLFCYLLSFFAWRSFSVRFSCAM